jgi:hypothetical protein
MKRGRPGFNRVALDSYTSPRHLSKHARAASSAHDVRVISPRTSANPSPSQQKKAQHHVDSWEMGIRRSPGRQVGQKRDQRRIASPVEHPRHNSPEMSQAACTRRINGFLAGVQTGMPCALRGLDFGGASAIPAKRMGRQTIGMRLLLAGEHALRGKPSVREHLRTRRATSSQFSLGHASVELRCESHAATKASHHRKTRRQIKYIK